ncbi:poly(ADP-ribose) glycohydrolase [Entamoeba marina]
MESTQRHTSKIQKCLIRKVIDTTFNTVKDVSNFFIEQEINQHRRNISEKANGISVALHLLYDYLFKTDKVKQTWDEYFEWYINNLKRCLKDLLNQPHEFITQDDNYIYLPISPPGHSDTFVFTRWEISGILSACFFNVEWDDEFNKSIGSLSFQAIKNDKGISSQRLVCIYSYLHVMFTSEENILKELVTFQRHVMLEPHDWTKDESLLKEYEYVEGGIEESTHLNHVDFANKLLHIHRIIPSATQEELLFSLRPECFLGIQLFEVMNDRDSITINNTSYINGCVGYAETFEWKSIKSREESTKQNTIIAIDSVIVKCFGEKNILRDLNKCYSGFSVVEGGIATGQWGCGAF